LKQDARNNNEVETKMNKTGKMDNMWPIVILVIAALVLFSGPISEKIGGGADETTTTTTTPEVTGIGLVCGVDTTTVDFKADDLKIPGTPVTSNATYWVNGVSKGVHSTDAAGFTASPTDEVDAVFALEAEDVYGDHVEGVKIECKGTQTISGQLYKQDSGAAVTLFDPNGVVNIAGSNFTVTQAESPKFELRMDSGNSKRYYGNPATGADNVMTCVFNYSQYDELILYKDGQVVEPLAASPRIVSDVSGSEKTSWGVPIIAGADMNGFQIEVVADDTVDPAADIPCYINDVDFYLNNKNGLIEFGVEDEEDADKGISGAVSFTLGLA